MFITLADLMLGPHYNIAVSLGLVSDKTPLPKADVTSTGHEYNEWYNNSRG